MPDAEPHHSETVNFSLSGSEDTGSAYVAWPKGPGPHPAVLVLHEILGLNDDIKRIANRFAAEGYVAMAPDYFGPGFRLGCIVRGVRSLHSGQGAIFERLASAQDWLRSAADVDPDKLGVVGFCMGGGFAVLHAANSDVHVVAEYYGDVPAQAERLRGIPPCFAGFGDRDRAFGPKAKKLRSHLSDLGVEHEVISYPDAGHSYMSQNEGVLAWIGSKGPMNVGYDPTASEDSWSRMLAFFAIHLSDFPSDLPDEIPTS